jgi:hypothetical protein
MSWKISAAVITQANAAGIQNIIHQNMSPFIND